MVGAALELLGHLSGAINSATLQFDECHIDCGVCLADKQIVTPLPICDAKLFAVEINCQTMRTRRYAFKANLAALFHTTQNAAGIRDTSGYFFDQI